MKRLKLENKVDVINQIKSYLERNPEAKFIHRLQAIYLFSTHENESCDSLGVLLDNSPRSISKWIKKVNLTGSIESLRSKRQPGRSSRLTKAQKDEVIHIIRDSPAKQGIPDKRWNGRNLSRYIGYRYGVVLDVRSCQRLFHKFYTNKEAPSRGNGVSKSELKSSR